MTIYSGRLYPQPKRHTVKVDRLSVGAVVMLILACMFLGYMVSMWQQIAQHRLEDERIIGSK